MHNLITLANIITKQKVKDLNLFDRNVSAGNKQYLLYIGIIKKQIRTDKDAINQLYGKKVSKNNLEMLKSRLKQKLLNALFFIDLNKPSYSDYSKSKINVYKQWSIINILLNRSARPVAIEICESAYRQSHKYGFTDLEILLCRVLMHHYGHININIKKYQKYTSIIFEKIKILEKELITEKYYNDISQEYIRSKSPNNTRLKTKLEKYCKELSAYEKKHKTYTLCYYYYRLLLAKYLLDENYEQAKDTCIKGLEFFSRKNLKTPVAEFLFRHDLHSCHFQLKEYDKAVTLIKENISLATPYSYNWLREWGYYFGWAVVTKNFDEMLKATYMATSNRKLKDYPLLFETWSIKESYVQILVQLDLVDSKYLENYKLKKFRLTKFLNDVPEYSKDKRGLNVSILIAHFIHLLIKKEYDLILNKIDNLRQYSYRYLRNDSTLRSNCFIKMISKVSDSNYHPQALKRHTKKLQLKLENTTYSYADNPAEIEVIPYETLWDIVLEILAKNQKQN